MILKEDEDGTVPLVLHNTLKYSVLGLADDTIYDNAAVPELSSAIAGRRHDIFLDINDGYVRDILLRAFSSKDFSIRLGAGHGDEPVSVPNTNCFQFAEYERIDWRSVLSSRHGASSYCIRKGISRKAHLSHYTRLHASKHPDSILHSAMPQTLIIDTWNVHDTDNNNNNSCDGLADVICNNASSRRHVTLTPIQKMRKCLERAKAVMMESSDMWILKPSTTNRGVGIQIIHLYEQLFDHLLSHDNDIREWVLQRYIHPPLLIHRRKFHIRAYVLAVSALQVYFYEPCLTLLCARRYSENSTDMLAHLSNTCLQRTDQQQHTFHRPSVLLWGGDDMETMVSSSTMRSRLEVKSLIQSVQRTMKCVTGELFRAYEHQPTVFHPLPKCFEHYGLDFMVDDDWNVYLLEVNPGPDYRQTGNRLRHVVQGFMEDTIRVVFLGLGAKHVTHPKEDGIDGNIGKKYGNGLTLVYECPSRSGSNNQDVRMTFT